MAAPTPPDEEAKKLMKEADAELKKAMRKVKAEFDSARDFIKRECKEISALLSKCSKSYKSDVKEFERDWEDLQEKAEDYDEFSNTVASFSQILRGQGMRMTSKQLGKLVILLSQTGASIEELASCLEDNLSNLDTDLSAIHSEINRLDGAAKATINTIAERARKAAGNIDQANANISGMIDNATTKAERLNKTAEAIKKQLKSSDVFKTDPRKVASDLKAINNLTEKEFNDFAVKFGLDPESKTDLQARLGEISATMESDSLDIADMMEEMAKDSSKDHTEAINQKLASMAKEAAESKKHLAKITETAQEQREVVRVASEGFFGLAESAQKASDSFRDGLSDLQRLDFSSARSSFTAAVKQLRVLHNAGKAVSAEAGPGMLGTLASFARGITLLAGAGMALLAFLALLNKARDQAVELNKTLISAGGLVGLGLNMKADISPQQIRDKLTEVRDDIISFGTSAFDYAVDSKEVAQVLEDLGKQGVLISELKQGGANAREAIKGVFTYARLLGKSDSEMAGIMGEMATSLNLSMDQVESRFADLTNRWQGSRISIDQFISTVQEISSQHNIYGDYMNETSKLLEKTGKNALLTSEQALEATKAGANVLDSMDDAAIRALVESAGGGNAKEYMANQLKKRAANLEAEIAQAKAKGGTNVEALTKNLNEVNAFIKSTTESNAQNIDFTAAYHKLGVGQKVAGVFRQAQNNLHMTDAELASIQMKDLRSSGEYGFKMRNAVGRSEENWNSLVALAESMQEGNKGNALDVIEALNNSNNLIGDMTDQVDANNKKAKDASVNLLTSEKAMAIATEGLLSKLYGIVNIIEGYVEKIANFMGGQSDAQKTADAAQKAASEADMTGGSGTVSTQASSEATKDTIGQLDKLLTDKTVSEEKFKENWEKLPAGVQKSIEQIASGNTKSISAGNFSEEQIKDLVVKSAGIVKKAESAGAKSKTTNQTVKAPASLESIEAVKRSGASAEMLKAAAGKGLTTADISNAELDMSKRLQKASTGKADNLTTYTQKGTRTTVDVGDTSQVFSPVAGKVLGASKYGIQIQPTNKSGDGKKYTLFMNTRDFVSAKNAGDILKAGDEVGKAPKGFKVVYAAFQGDGKEIGISALLNAIGQTKESQKGLLNVKKQGSGINPGFGTLTNLASEDIAQTYANANFTQLINSIQKGQDAAVTAADPNGGSAGPTTHDHYKMTPATSKYNFNISVDDQKLVRNLRRSVYKKERLERFKRTYFG